VNLGTATRGKHEALLNLKERKKKENTISTWPDVTQKAVIATDNHED